jgi:competence protein ComEC
MRHLKTRYLFRVLAFGIFMTLLIYKVNLKDYLIVFIESTLPVNEGVMLKSMLWGGSKEISQEMYQQMIKTGLIHILVVSGTNMMLVVKNLIELTAGYLGRKTAIIVGLVIGLVYAEMVGWQIPVTRALLMVSWLYLAQALGRKYDVFRGLILVLIIMIVANYKVLLEISFWLSFISFGAISFKTNEGVFKSTLRVMIWLTPLLAYQFGKISLISPISNLLVLFLVPIITLGGMIASFISIIWNDLGKFILWGLYPILKYVGVTVELLSQIKWAQINLEINGWMMVGCYLLGFGWWFKRRKLEK